MDRAPPKNHLKALIRRAVQRRDRFILNEEETKRFLINYGIPTVKHASRQQRRGGDQRLPQVRGYPVVLKIVSPDITYKSDVGGVVMGINSDERAA